MRQHIVLTLTGRDRPGLVEEVTRLLTDQDGNVEAGRMAKLGGEFVMLLLVTIPAENLVSLQNTVVEFSRCHSEDQVEIQVRCTDTRDAREGAGVVCGLTVMGANPGGAESAF